MKVVGIDLSTEPRKCGVCVIEGPDIAHVGRGIATFLHPDWLLTHPDWRHAHPDWLLEYCTGADAVGVDVPFGWPIPFIEALCGYRIGMAFDRDRRPYRLRTTDIWITDGLAQCLQRDTRPPEPFAVAADKLGNTAMVGTRLLQSLSEEFEVSPRCSGTARAVLEVYPSASLWAWGLRNRSVDVHATLEILGGAFDLDIREDARRQLLESRHCFDALVTALTAQEYVSGNTCDPPENVSEDTLRVEGWIRVPNRSLTDTQG